MVKEVKRNAVRSDKIKIVNADAFSLAAGVKNGQVYIVDMTIGAQLLPLISVPPIDKLDLCHDEYVVLEECEPTLSEATESELEAELKKRREPKYFTGDVVCIDESRSFRKGKIYEVKNGSLKGDFGGAIFDEVKNVEELNRKACAQFIELVK